MSLIKSLLILVLLFPSFVFSESDYGDTATRKELIDRLKDELTIEETKAKIAEAKNKNKTLKSEAEKPKDSPNIQPQSNFGFREPVFIEDAELIEIFDTKATFIFDGKHHEITVGESIEKYKLIALEATKATLQRNGKKYQKRLQVSNSTNNNVPPNNSILPTVLFAN